MSTTKIKADSAALREKISLYFCPIALGTAICYSVIHALYKEMAVPYTAIFVVIEIFLYLFFDRIKKRRILGGIFYTVILVAIVFTSLALVVQGMIELQSWNAPSAWFYGSKDIEHEQPLFLNAVFIGGGYFLTSILYYFTQVRYRRLGLMLCILFPFVIYAKRSEIMPELMVTIIITLYIAAIVHNRQTDPSQPQNKKTLMKTDRAYIISIAVFISVTGAVTMLIDKPTYRSKLETNSNYFDYAPRTEGGGGSFESVSRTSARRYGARNYSGSTLFNFHSDGDLDVYYLRRQSYSQFNGRVWTADFSGGQNRLIYTADDPEYSTNDILADMQVLLEGADLFSPKLTSGRVYSESFSPMYLPAPFSTVADYDGVGNARYVKYKPDTILRTSGNIGSNSPLNEDIEFYEQTPQLYEFAAQLMLTSEGYENALRSNGSEEALRLLDDFIQAAEDNSDMRNISEETAQLAGEITADCYSDFDKAKTLEQYFELNGFVYDESYAPEDESIEYFLFEGKTGVCTSYATAMTLMARSVGLTARYVEGFAAFEKDENGDFIIRDKHSHAFVEVYIPGTGWLTFDPTVSGYMQLNVEEEGGFTSFLLRLLGRVQILIIVAVFVLISLLRDRIYELFFRISQLFRTPKQQTLKLYANVIHLLSFSQGEDISPYTVGMVRDFVAATRGDVPEKLLTLFEKTAFGGYEPSKDEYREAYGEYKRCYRYLRRKPMRTREPAVGDTT